MNEAFHYFVQMCLHVAALFEEASPFCPNIAALQIPCSIFLILFNPSLQLIQIV